MGSTSAKERNPGLSQTRANQVPPEVSTGWEQHLDDLPAALVAPESKPPTDPGTPYPMSVPKSQESWQGLTCPPVYLHRYRLDIYTNNVNICRFIRQDKS